MTLLTGCKPRPCDVPGRLHMPDCMKDYLRGEADALCGDGIGYLKDLAVQQERLPEME